MPLSDADRAEIARARMLLESRNLAVRLTDMIGRPIETGLARLPAATSEAIQSATRRALNTALRAALGTLRRGGASPSSDRIHRVAASASGALGGLFGLPGLAVELPVTTVVMLRSIADIARAEGHDLADPATRMACLEVFALGGSARAEDAAETGYYAVRGALSGALQDAARHLATRGLSREGAPALVRAVAAIAARFGVIVEEKLVLEGIPVIGAVGGALVNRVFMAHFQDRARGHFVIRRLETTHGPEAVRAAWAGVVVDPHPALPRPG